MAAGDFSASSILKVQLNMAKFWGDDLLKKRFSQPVETLKAITDRQTARFDSKMYDRKKNCNVYEAYWLKACESVVDTCADTCDVIGGAELESDKTQYSTTKCARIGFVADEKDCNNITFEEIVATAIMSKKADIRKKINQDAVLWLNANLSAVNKHADTIGAFAAGAVTYTPAVWADLSSLITDIALLGTLNEINSPVLVNGMNLYKSNFLSKFNESGGCCNTADAKGLLGTIDAYWDILYLQGALANEKASFLFDANGVAFLSDSMYQSDVPQQIVKSKPIFGYSERDELIPQIVYDIQYTPECYSSNGILKEKWKFDVIAHYDFFKAPTICPGDSEDIFKLINA
jgi:hypothetical protein